MYKRLKSLLCTACLVGVYTPAFGQIAVERLTPAERFDAGVMQSKRGGLGPDLWQGTNANTAIALINAASNANTKPSDDAQMFLRAALLSGGAPPQANSNEALSAFQAARLKAALRLTSLKNYDFIAARTSPSGGAPTNLVQTADRALIGGDEETACQTAGMVREGRAEPYWSELRAFCHFLAGEQPAMELTVDLLRQSGYKDDGFYTLLGALSGSNISAIDGKTITTPLHLALAVKAYENEKLNGKNWPAQLLAQLANNSKTDPAMRLKIIQGAAPLLEPSQIQSLLLEISDAPLGSLDQLPAHGKWTAKDWGGTYLALRNSRDINAQAGLLAALLKEAQSDQILMPIAGALASEIAILPYGFQARFGADVFAQVAIGNGDLGALRAIHAELDPKNPARARIALASDALGNGFMLSALGKDIEAELSGTGAKKTRAIRDVYVAGGMGAHLSQSAYSALERTKSLPGKTANAADVLALRGAAKRGSKAETALWVAKILGPNDIGAVRADSVAQILMALNDAGMSDLAGALAAHDFMDKTPS